MTSSLLHILFGPAAGLVTSTSPRLDLWSAAFADWLASLPARDQALNAWEQLLRFHRCPPWELDRSKLESWTSHLAETGLSANTIRCYQGRISGFFRFCSKRPELLSAEPMFGSPKKPRNPLRCTPKPTLESYKHAYILRPAEARSLLRAVDRQSSLIAKRDYALLLTLLLTGLPEADLRKLRWSQLDFTPQAVLLTSSDAASAKELPPPAWSAIHAWLEASGRLASIRPDDYIFVPLSDPLLRPPSADPADWRRDRPLSQEQIYAFLKCYAAWAGLSASKVTYACLRHTAAALHLGSGADSASLQAFLGRKYLKDTRRYIGHLGLMLGRRPHPSARPSLQVPRAPYLRKKPHAQPGNLNAIKHGFFAHSLREEDSQDLHELTVAAIDQEIMALRVLLRRAFSLSDDLDNFPDTLRMLNIFGRTAERVGKLLLHKRNLQVADKKAALDAAIEQAILEVGRELGFGATKV